MLPPVARTFLIDTDTASDDAVALIMALRAPDVRVAAITIVAGNVDVEQATRNALYTIDLCGAKVAVYSGENHCASVGKKRSTRLCDGELTSHSVACKSRVVEILLGPHVP